MLKTIILTATLTLAGGAAFACPNIAASGATINASATQLYSTHSYNVVAGGSSQIDKCGIRTFNGVRAEGWVMAAPDFELNYYKDANYQLEIRVVSDCDAVLLVNDGDGDWLFDDDSNANSALDPAMRITNPAAGTYDIWVGTLTPGTCNARLEIETF